MQQYIRYQILDKCFRERRSNLTWQELADACGKGLREQLNDPEIENPARRTVFNDMDTMRSGNLGYKAPIIFNRREGYHYENAEFSIAREPVKPEQRLALDQAFFTLKQFGWSMGMENMHTSVMQLENDLLGEVTPYRQALLLDQPHNAGGRGMWLETLLKAIQKETRVRLVYQPFNMSEPYGTEVSPYLLKEYNNRWFLIGFDHPNLRVQNYGLERIRDIQVLDKPVEPQPFDLRSHFHQVIGVTVTPGMSLERVVFRATVEQARYIDTKPIHRSQRILREEESGVVFAIDVIPNFELESVLLAFGERVEVLAPDTIRERISQRLRLALAAYSPITETMRGSDTLPPPTTIS